MVAVDLSPYLFTLEDEPARAWLIERDVLLELTDVEPTDEGSMRAGRFKFPGETNTLALALYFYGYPNPDDNGFMVVGYQDVPESEANRIAGAIHMTTLETTVIRNYGGQFVPEDELRQLWRINQGKHTQGSSAPFQPHRFHPSAAPAPQTSITARESATTFPPDPRASDPLRPSPATRDETISHQPTRASATQLVRFISSSSFLLLDRRSFRAGFARGEVMTAYGRLGTLGLSCRISLPSLASIQKL